MKLWEISHIIHLNRTASNNISTTYGEKQEISKVIFFYIKMEELKGRKEVTITLIK